MDDLTRPVGTRTATVPRAYLLPPSLSAIAAKLRGHNIRVTTLDKLPAGSFQVDMAQPMANAAFYYLEPQARDGFVGWGVMDDVLRALGAAARPVVYPVFKVRWTVQ